MLHVLVLKKTETPVESLFKKMTSIEPEVLNLTCTFFESLLGVTVKEWTDSLSLTLCDVIKLRGALRVLLL